MTHLWTWSGEYFGYRHDDDLWTQDGFHVGRFVSDEVYEPQGTYLGEIQNTNRLIVNESKKSKRVPEFPQKNRRKSITGFMEFAGFTLFAGHADFPEPSYFDP